MTEKYLCWKKKKKTVGLCGGHSGKIFKNSLNVESVAPRSPTLGYICTIAKKLGMYVCRQF